MDYSVVGMGLEGGSGLLDLLTGGSAGFTAPADFGFFVFIYDFVRHEIKALGFTMMARASYFASLVALALVTMWIFYQGLRIFSGKGDSLMALVLNSARVGFIVTAAISMGAAGSAVYDTVGVKLPGVITGYITDSSNTVEQQIDNSLFAMTVAMKTIDALEVVSDPTIEDDKNRALYMIAVGTAGPAVTAGALLLFYQAALALFVGLGPIFILCLMFDQTKDLFRRWLMYGIGTMFSMAVLAAMTSISLKAVIAVAAANFSTALASNLLGMNLSSGITSASMQQGGIGLLLTLMIVMVPPMAANFFQGTLGNFAAYSQVSNGSPGYFGGNNRGANNERQRLETAQGVGQNTNNTRTDRTSVNSPQPSSTPNNQALTGSQPQVGSGADVIKTSPNSPAASSPSTTVPPSNPNGNLIADNSPRGRGNNGPGGVA